MKKLLVICGPTATGKTSLGLHLAKNFDGELVSADSRQVYRGMNIGTGKELASNSEFRILNSKIEYKIRESLDKKVTIGVYKVGNVAVWGFDLVEPNQDFSVALYCKFAKWAIEDIWKRDKLPVLVGGTGFYLKAITDGIETLGMPPDWELRWRLRNLTVADLFNLLARLDPDKTATLNYSDRRNPRRLIRAIELSYQKDSSKEKKGVEKLNLEKLLTIGLIAANKVIYERIDRRVENRLKQGIEEEIKGLLKKGYSWDNSVLNQTLGYREWRSFFEGKSSREDVVQRWKYNEHAYVRRQLTWFRRDKRVRWFDIIEKDWQVKAEKQITLWFKEN
ncbi:MAG TPA: tRNA (adenosine(37)-N6)-dimethylallyltransferase MiaA [Candidatus Bathyarchaeia archaeon]|nr:tRNA (adenosine(37)-N6)-dimethylallyltransferase MiaA [Candidatus Bathyarchaeia archaeon]